MNRICLLGVIAGAIILSMSCCKPKYVAVKLENSTDSVSYALGYMNAYGMKQSMFGRGRMPFDSIDYQLLAQALTKYGLNKEMKEMLESQFNEIDEGIFIKAFVNELGFGKSLFDETTANTYLQGEYSRIREKIAQDNLEKGQKFLDENGKRAGVVTLESGLQYEIITAGDGEIPTEDDTVVVHYHGTLIDGTVFDSSVERLEPAKFGTTRVIKGWTEALLLMPKGSKWMLYIPADLAYGNRGSGREIGPNQTLIFEVELIEIETK